MEGLAYTYCCAAYEEAEGIEYDFPEWEPNWTLPSSAWIGLSAVVAAISILSTSASAFAISAGRHYVANSRGLNVRNSPGGYVVKTLRNGQAVDLTGRTSGAWAQTVPGNWVYASLLTGGSSRPSQYPTGGRYILRPGSRGAAVSSVQRALRDNGFDISVDGYYGPQTYRVVRAYQEYQRRAAKIPLTIDGLVGPQTRSALFG